MTRRIFFALIAVALLLFSGCEMLDKFKRNKSGPSDESDEEVAALIILTGSKTGNYYKTAKELNEVLGSEALDIKSSAGSFQNIGDLGSGKADLAIAQYDSLVVHLRLGKKFAKRAQNAMVVAPLSEEFVHIVVNKKANIRTLKDLKGKKIGVGPEHSGSWISAFLVMLYLNATNIEKSDEMLKLPYAESLEKVAAGEIDAAFITTAPGMPLLKDFDAERGKNIELLDLPIDLKLHKDITNVYTVAEIEGDTYPWQTETVSTLATPSYLLAYSKADAARIEKLAKTVYSNADALKKKSDLWQHVSAKRAKQDIGNNIPYHAGAKRALGVK
jgi:TRAP transporter TAXI family solute receptor